MSKKNNLNIDEQIVRLVATQVVIITIVSILTKWWFPFLFLTIDFALRAFTTQLSPLAALAKIIAKAVQLKPKPIFAPPKKFAASIGFVFSLTLLFLFFFDYNFIAQVVGSILLLCAVLESVFKICVGCYVYDWLVAPIANKRNNF